MADWTQVFTSLAPKPYGRRQPLLLVNGLAEQAESWYRNRRFWSRYFDVHAPNVVLYDGPVIHGRLSAKQPIDVDYLVGEFHAYLTRFVQTPPVHLVASSLGGKIAVELAVRYPQLVSRVVLLCPSGMGDEERLPIMDGVRGDTYALVRSVFFKPKFVDRDMVKFYRAKLADRVWKTGLLRTVRGTLDHSVRSKLARLTHETLLVTGSEDKICDPKTAAIAARDLPNGHFLEVANCGHAPQIEKHWLINRLVVYFLTAPKPTANPNWPQLMFTQPSKLKNGEKK
ncbi:MAG: alpha/beta hydrolase [Fimbriiglobus sp.]|jgi:pimeloyl-ACP methyl ester carboxylesterase|nr:alpha/beta hydrolase [Fimbriiglobus sp.]